MVIIEKWFVWEFWVDICRKYEKRMELSPLHPEIEKNVFSKKLAYNIYN